MASIGDLWFTNGRKTARHPDNGGNPKSRRWKARWINPDGTERAKCFARKIDAQQFIERLGSHRCLVPECHHGAATEPPVLLCQDHLTMVLINAGKKRPGAHEPRTYFVRNGSRVKIGWTTNIKSRMTALSLPMSAVLLTLDGGPEKEIALHHRFASARIGRTEWFDLTPDLEAFIETQRAMAEAT